MRLASVQGWEVKLGRDGCCRPIKQTTTKLRCCVVRKARGDRPLRKKNDLRSPTGLGDAAGGFETRAARDTGGEATELAEMIFTGVGRPGARVCCNCCLRTKKAYAGKPFIIW